MSSRGTATRPQPMEPLESFYNSAGFNHQHEDEFSNPEEDGNESVVRGRGIRRSATHAAQDQSQRRKTAPSGWEAGGPDFLDTHLSDGEIWNADKVSMDGPLSKEYVRGTFVRVKNPLPKCQGVTLKQFRKYINRRKVDVTGCRYSGNMYGYFAELAKRETAQGGHFWKDLHLHAEESMVRKGEMWRQQEDAAFELEKEQPGWVDRRSEESREGQDNEEAFKIATDLQENCAGGREELRKILRSNVLVSSLKQALKHHEVAFKSSGYVGRAVDEPPHRSSEQRERQWRGPWRIRRGKLRLSQQQRPHRGC